MTSDEEQTIVWAKKLPRKNKKNRKISPFKFKYLINTDCLKSDKIYVGCPGCELFNMKFFPCFELVNKGVEINIKLDNFKGGHSAETIIKGQVNPIKWITKILNSLKTNKINFQIASFQGGQMMNTIPTNCQCTFIKNKNVE